MYLTEPDVRKILEIIGNNFSNVTVFMETMSPYSDLYATGVLGRG